MKTAVIFIAIVLVAFVIIYITTQKNPLAGQTTSNFLTPTPVSDINYPVGQDNNPGQQNPNQQPQGSKQVEQVSATTATIKTAKGDIVVELYPTDTPKTVTNFASLAKAGYYNNLTFHRVEPGFVIQGGDPSGNGTGGYSIYGDTFEDEIDTSKQIYVDGYKEGVLAMANRGADTNGSQFFIMLADNESLPKNYTIFGKVTSGMDVVKKIQVGDKILTIQPE